MAKKKTIKKKIVKGPQGKKKKDIMPVEDVIDLIITDACPPYISNLAKVLGWTWLATKRYIQLFPELEAVMEERKTEMVETAENVVKKALEDNDNPKERNNMARWVLGMRKKEYRQQQDVNVSGNIDQTVTIVIATKKDKDNLNELLNE